ncbi:MAG: ABC transporter substrate-binding protein [Pseudomonadota bacterium]
MTCILEKPHHIASLRDDSVTTALRDIDTSVFAAAMRSMENGSRYVRAARSDLIIARTYQAEAADQLNAIAPTVIMPNVLTYLDKLAFLADTAGTSSDFDAELSRYQARIAEAREVIGDSGSITVSRFDIWEDGLCYHPAWGAMAQVIDNIGLDLPEIHDEASENMKGVSVERITEWDGDILIASRAPRFGQTIEMLTAQRDIVAPFWRDLSGIADGNLYWFERDILIGNTFESLDRSIGFLTALTAGQDFD